jgi:hypothetical protein
MRALAAAFLIAAACHRPAPVPAPAPGSPEALAAYLKTATPQDAAGWILDEAGWDRIVVPPYRKLWPEYKAHFDAALAPVIAQLPHAGPTRRHYAGDPRLSNAQTRLRWALPVQYPSVVADGIDTVFVWDGSGWRVLAGLDDLLLAHVRALDPHCADLVARAGPPGHCSEVGWFVADTALEGSAGFAHACQLAADACGNSAP